MKYLIILFIFLNTFLYSQSKKKTDSVAYYTTLANDNIKINNYKNALFYTQKAINFCESNNKIEAQANQTFKLGKIYYDLKKYTVALEYFHKSIPLFETFRPTYNFANAYYYIGLCYMETHNYDIADFFFNKTKAVFTILKITDTTQLVNLQKGIIYKNKKKYNQASTIFKTIIAQPYSQIMLNSKAEALYQMGTIEAINNRSNLALNYYKKALKLNAKSNNFDQKSDILFALSSVYEKMLDKSNAFSFLKQHLNLKENISILNSQRLGVDDYEKFKETQRLKEALEIKKQNLEKQKANKFSKMINILSVSLISILSLLSFSLYKNNNIKKKSNLLLEEKNNELIIAKNKAEEASRARSEFLSTVSHELRTPLNAINGIANLLLEENPKKSQLNYLSSLKFSGNYLTTFINDILEVNRIDSKKVEVENINFNLKQLLRNIQNSLKELASTNDNDFKLEIDSEIPENLVGDPTKLSQIFMNLINNAIKFTQNGSVVVTAKLISINNKKVELYFAVKDNGIGIPEDKLETVFDSFSQGSVEINRKYGGTGLGLTIVKKLVEILGGKIKLESEVGKGSDFSFKLNFIQDSKELPLEEKPKIVNESVLKNKKILLVEDNKINQMITRKMLENRGVICKIIDNGEEAIELVRNNKFDLILMDIHLPGINGTTATQNIRTFDADTPIIALTAISLNENKEMLMSFGMNDVITKPFEPNVFYKIIARNSVKS